MKKQIFLLLLLFITSLFTIGCQLCDYGLLLPNNPSPTPEEYFTFDEETRTITSYDNGTGDGNPYGDDIVIPPTINGIPVEHIGHKAFDSSGLYTWIRSVVLPDTITTIGSYACINNDLHLLTIPDSVISIGSYAFYGNSLTVITIPDSINFIDEYVFGGNPLKSITIGADVDIYSGQSIGYYKEGTYPSFEYEYVGFKSFYDANGREAGTYKLINMKWIKM
ncbi:MAG: leucine-rich repeat domain-containing protein [Atribacterota bacterium]|jgi:acetyltransferase-like isoleucine patch superfamily enzyme|nr:leucine-rich repeat domain-containing protein [Atribacterota bacterium]MDD4896495.1 leucine-rich repeat domain-containing protein [Atribacterota bacterium]MDD5638266.1 leucine-rich repeat domain-containing protein [Atribacterota bacterium]